MPYADPEQRKACAKRYRAQPQVKVRMNEAQRARVARLYVEKPDEFRAQRREWGRSHYAKSRMKTILREARKRAKEKGIPFDLVESDLTIPEFCPVFGWRLEVGVGKRSDRSPSLDRVIPELGYVKGNIRVISWRANHLKSDGAISELEKVIAYMRESAPT